jgi:Na+/melibiose symporter-like transporter
VNLAAIAPQPQPLDMQGQLVLLSSMLRKPAVYRPLVWFLSSYAVIPLLGSTMFFYQTQQLGLDSSVIGLVKVVGQTGLVAGSMLYNKKLKKVPLRKLFGGLQVLLSLCMLSDIVLVTRLNVQVRLYTGPKSQPKA